MSLHNIVCWTAVLAVAILSAVHGQGTFVPSQSVDGDFTNPISVFPGVGSRSGFKKVLVKNNVTKWQQTVEGIPVYGSVLTTRGDETGKINQVQGIISFTADVTDVRPDVTSDEALRLLQTQQGHEATEKNLIFRVDKPELQVLQGENGRDKLIWKVAYYVDWANFQMKPLKYRNTVPSYMIGLVNAHTSVIEDSWNNLPNATTTINAVVGNAKTGKQIVRFDVEKISGRTCKHRDDVRRIEVFDMWDRRQITSQTTSSFTCNNADNDNWDLFSRTGAYSPRNEVYHHAQQFVDLWTELMGNEVKPYQTDSSYLRFYTHYDQNYENAFFDGDSFKFGDGARIFYPLTSLDIVCHEIGHSVTQWHGGNMEYIRQSGAMNEAYSDILGETCDIHFKKRSDGLIGTDIMRPGNRLGTSMRNMCDPPKIGNALDHMRKYNDRIDVHYTSGIYNKAWCTLKNTVGWDYKMAFEVFTDANLLYWNPRSTMHCGACGVESAAENRGYSKADVTASFNAVGVSCGSCGSQ